MTWGYFFQCVSATQCLLSLLFVLLTGLRTTRCPHHRERRCSLNNSSKRMNKAVKTGGVRRREAARVIHAGADPHVKNMVSRGKWK